MAKESTVLDFYQRFQTIQAQRETSDTLIKVRPLRPTSIPGPTSKNGIHVSHRLFASQDLILYCEHIETTLHGENLRLTKQVEDTKLDLADSIQSRRELQKRIEEVKNDYTRISQEHELFKVIS
jgi:hypothetical protein